MALTKRVTVFDVFDRAKSGAKLEESEWDYKIIPQTATKLKKKYNIKMDKKTIVPTDPELINNLFNAGLDMLVECGVYCIDTKRVIKYTRDEILASLKAAPKKVMYGEGKDAVELSCRSFKDSRPPLIQGGPTGAPCSEELFLPIHQSYAQEPLVDTIVDGVLQTIHGKDPKPGTPWEIAAVKTEAIMVRAAQLRAGRPGMGLQGNETSLSAAGVIAADFPGGMRPSDSHEVSQLNELKIDISALTFDAHYVLSGNIIMCEQMPIFGGYAGGLEETTIIDVATTINSFVMTQATWHLDGPVHVRWGITTAREPLAIAAHAARAIEANTHLMLGNQYYTMAGPCTVMCLLEVAAQAMTDTASGREILSGVAPRKGVLTDWHTGMEARMMAEAARAVAGMDIEKVDEILDKLVASYEKDFKTAPEGKGFADCYDVTTLTPTDEYIEVYQEAVKILTDLGLTYWTDNNLI